MAFGRGWWPASWFTWTLPAAFLAIGAVAGKTSRYCWRLLEEKKESSLAKPDVAPVEALDSDKSEQRGRYTTDAG
jgi:hypothetical protein